MKRYRGLLAVLSIVALAIAGCASGSAIVTGTKRPAINPAWVKVYLEPPSNYEVIGLVSASSDAGWTEQDSVNSAVQELKKQAGNLGANGVLLVATGDTSTVVSGYVIAGKSLQAKAIFVTGQ